MRGTDVAIIPVGYEGLVRAMIVVAVVAVVVVARLGFVAVVFYEANAKDPGDDCGDEADDGPDNGNDEAEEGIGD